MSFKDMKRDDHGHVISNDEVDGQKCQHGAGGSHKYGKDSQGRHYVDDNKGDRQFFAKEEDAKDYEKRMNEAQGFDDDYEEEFGEDEIYEKPNKNLNEGDIFSVDGREFEVTKIDRDGKHIVGKDLKTGEEFDWTDEGLYNAESFKLKNEELSKGNPFNPEDDEPQEQSKQEKSDNKIITRVNANKFLEKNGLADKYYFDGGDLVDAETGKTLPIYVGNNGAQEDSLLKKINNLGKKVDNSQPDYKTNKSEFEKFPLMNSLKKDIKAGKISKENLLKWLDEE